MGKFDRRVGTKIAAAILALAFGAVGSAQAQDTFRFGLAMPLTGSQALYGQDQVKTAEWAVAEINKARTAFLDLDVEAESIAAPVMDGRAIDLEQVLDEIAPLEVS